MPSSRTATLPADILMDTAVLYVDRGTPTPASTKVGGTRGGLRFIPGTRWRNVEYDGGRTTRVGLQRITGWERPRIEGTLLQMNEDTAAMLETGSTSATAAAVVGPPAIPATTTITPKGASDPLVEDDYVANVRCVWSRGNGGTATVVFPLGWVDEYSVGSTDNNEGEFPIVIVAVQTEDQEDDEAPYYIELTGPDIVAA